MTDFTMFSGDFKRVRIQVLDDLGAEVDLDLATEIIFQIAEWAGGPVILQKTKSGGAISTFIPAGSTVKSGLQATILTGDLAVRSGDDARWDFGHGS
jgi:hypothetical protein